MSATKAPHAYKTFFISSLPSSSELEYYGFYGPNSVTLQQQSGRNIRFLGAMLNTQKVPGRSAAHCTNAIFFQSDCVPLRLVGSTTTADSEMDRFAWREGLRSHPVAGAVIMR
jgi:hypothetical protein